MLLPDQIMFRALFLVLCFSFAMGIPDQGPKGPPLLIRVENCCAKNLLQHDDMDKDVLKECFTMDMKPHTCEKDICIATKKGFASSDGTIDKKVLQDILENDFKDNTVALEAILEKCVNGDVSKFGKEDFCELMKMNNCIEVHTIKSCDEWKDTEDCKKLKAWVDPLMQKFE